MKRTVKTLIKKTLLSTKAIRIVSMCRPPGVVILRYHSILHAPEKINDIIGCGIVHDSTVFEQQMKVIRESFVPVSMDDVHDFAVGIKKLPKRSVAITFDDGFSDNEDIAVPIINKFGIKGAFYITTGCVAPQDPPWFVRLRRAFHVTTRSTWEYSLDNSIYNLEIPVSRRQAFLRASGHCAVLSYSKQGSWLENLEEALEVEKFTYEPSIMMTEAQIMKLYKEGHIVGSHTVSHPNVAHIGEHDLRIEMLNSKHKLEEIIGETVFHFSYPSPILQPHYNEKTMRMAKELGYTTAVTCTKGLVNQGDNPLCCKRISVSDNIDEFIWSLESLFSGYLTV